MAHRHEHLCSASQLWLPHPVLCVVLPECFRGPHVWSGAMGSKSSKLQNVADHDTSQRQGVIASIITFHLGHHFLDLINTPLLSWDDILTLGPLDQLYGEVVKLEDIIVNKGGTWAGDLKMGVIASCSLENA